MFTAATSSWLRLGLTRCYYRLAKRRESKSAASDTQTFSTTGPGTMTAIYVGLNCPVYTSVREERDHWASLTDDLPYPHYEGVGWLMLSSFPGFLLRGMAIQLEGERQPLLLCISVLTFRSVCPRDSLSIQESLPPANLKFWVISDLYAISIHGEQKWCEEGRKLRFFFYKFQTLRRHVANRLTPRGVLLLPSPRPSSSEAWCRERVEGRGRGESQE